MERDPIDMTAARRELEKAADRSEWGGSVGVGLTPAEAKQAREAARG